MTATRRLLLALSAALACTTLTGCAAANDARKPDPSPAGYFRTVTVNVDGRPVRCVTWKQGYAGGISCDWQGGVR